MTESVSKYQIYCNTEGKNVTGWGTSIPTVCYNNSEHSVGAATTLETIVNANAANLTSVVRYKIYCETESKYVEGWGTTSPTACYTNTAHTVNPNSVQVLETVARSQVKIIEDSVNIKRNVRVEPISFTEVAIGATQHRTFQFKFVTSMYSFQFMTDDTNKGDELSIAINKDTPLGLITQNVSAGATTIYPPAAIFTYGWQGFNVYLSDGTNLDDLGDIITLNQAAGTITVSTPAVHSFSSSNTLLLMTYYTMKSLIIGPPGTYQFGNDVIGGAAVPVGTVVTFSYKNNYFIEELDAPKNLNLYMTLLF